MSTYDRFIRFRIGREQVPHSPRPGSPESSAKGLIVPGAAYDAPMAARTAPMIALGYGKFVRADRVYALVPLEGPERRDGRRTLVYIEGIDKPLVASRSEGAIAADLASSLGADAPGRRRAGRREAGQDPLF
jgi:hypothetical protein